MAFVSKEVVKNVRRVLKSSFPDCKFSVTGTSTQRMTVVVKKTPLFKSGDSLFINHYYVDQCSEINSDQKTFIKKLINVVRESSNHYNNTDLSTDLFDCSFYESYRVEIE